nr:choice-of-anchor I family protein [Chitinophagaceae bacterium]
NLVFSLPTTGYNNIVVKYATRRSGSGAHNQVVDYSTDGVNFINLTTLQPVDGNPTLQTLDFSAISAAANNPNFKIRISFTQGGGGLEGNNRFDNITLEGDPALVATEQLLHYWNFNTASSREALLTPTSSIINGASIAATEPGTTLVDWQNGSGQNFDLQNLNTRNGDPAGTHLRYNFPIPGELVFSLPTTNSTDILVKYVTRRSGSGAGTQFVEFSTDGNTFKACTTLAITETPTLQTIDFKDSAGVNNNPNFKLRIRFASTGGGEVGNNRFDNFTVDGKTTAVDLNPPSVNLAPANNATNVVPAIQPTITFSKDIRLTDNSPVTNENAASLVELKLNNAAGANVPFTATYANKVLTIIPTAPLTAAATYYYALKANVVEGTNDVPIDVINAASFTVQATSFISFAATNFVSVRESDGVALVTLNLTNPIAGSFKLSLMPTPWSNATANSDFSFASTTINTTAAFPTQLNFAIPIIDDGDAELDEYFVLGIEELNGWSLQGRKYLTIYIRDNDRKAPVPTEEIKLNYIGSFKPGPGTAGSTAEVTDYDPVSKRLFVISALQNRLDIVNFSNPASPQNISSISMAAYGGGINSVAVRNGVVAVASDNVNPQENGSVVFLDTNGVFLKQVTVGAMPDMLTFTPDGTKILTANEGEPNNAYTVDPEGSVSIIDISGGIAGLDQSKVTTVLFTSFNANEAALIAAGVRKVRKTGSTLSQDLEPEYITFSPDATKAWIVCQENNSIAELDIATASFTRIWGLGLKDFNTVSGGGIDASNNGGVVHISNWPVKSYFMPDAMATYSVGAKTYIVTANEGDEKEYAGLNERTTVGNNAVLLDPAKFPHAEMLKQPWNIGNFRITNLNGDNDRDGDYDDLINIGARSFSIWDAETGALVWDSKDQIELFTAQHPVFGAIFNADHEANGLKGRSHAKGPEPEGVTLAEIGGQTFAFVTLERIGGVLVYNISDPSNPRLVDYRNERTVNAVGGDRGAETVIYLDPSKSPDGKSYVIVSNEISGSLTIYEITGGVLPVNLITYQAQLQNNGTVLLQWATASERNNSHFILERSYNGREFEQMATVKSKGDSDAKQDYIHTDGKPGKGNIFYRLSQVDKDGRITQKGVRMVNISDDGLITIAPNPVRGNFINLQTGSRNGNLLVKLVDVQGRVVSSQVIQSTGGKASMQINPNIGTGIYYLQIDGQPARPVTILK